MIQISFKKKFKDEFIGYVLISKQPIFSYISRDYKLVIEEVRKYEAMLRRNQIQFDLEIR